MSCSELSSSLVHTFPGDDIRRTWRGQLMKDKEEVRKMKAFNYKGPSGAFVSLLQVLGLFTHYTRDEIQRKPRSLKRWPLTPGSPAVRQSREVKFHFTLALAKQLLVIISHQKRKIICGTWNLFWDICPSIMWLCGLGWHYSSPATKVMAVFVKVIRLTLQLIKSRSHSCGRTARPAACVLHVSTNCLQEDTFN